MAFIKHTTNPNAAVGGGCLGMNGVRGFDCKPPFFEATGVVCLNSTCPKPVICSYCLSELNRAAAGEAIPVGYGQVEAQTVADIDPALKSLPVEPPKPKRTRKPKQDEELSL